MRLRHGHMRLSKSNCQHVVYALGVKLEKFDKAGFRKEIERIGGRSLAKGQEQFIATIPTRTAWADYHVHLACHWTATGFHANVEYYPGAEKPHSGDGGPFAENIMAWLGQFFRNDKATARVIAAFIYSGRNWTASLPLPMRLPIGMPREVEIVGMVANIPTKPEGVHEAFVNLYDHKILVALEANRPVRFRRFHLYSEVSALSSIARLFVYGRLKK